MRISLEPAFILHQRPYRESSMLLDLLTREQGRIAVVARGVRKERSKLRALLQPFVPLLVSFQGKTELMNLITAEAHKPLLPLRGDCLLGALYLNELLMRVLQKHDAYPVLYDLYHETLLQLQGKSLQQKTLRIFEKKLLQELGYGLQLDSILTEKNYYFAPDQGFQICSEEPVGVFFLGRSLRALAEETLDDAEVLRDIRNLMRIAFGPLLGSQPLNSRKLFNNSCRAD